MDACRERGVTVCNCAGYSTVAVADLVFGLLIALCRSILPCDRAVREGGTKAGLIGTELEGKKFGIVGAGAIGLRVARIAEAFGMRGGRLQPYPKAGDGAALCRSRRVALRLRRRVAARAAQRRTRGLIGARELGLMKKTAFLINTARGPVVDSAALAKALSDGVIAGAGIDVFETEPPIPRDHPLFSAPNLVATPHVAFATKEALEKRAVIVFENLAAWLDGAPENVVR